MSDDPKMSFILERVRSGDTLDCFQLWLCRGEGKGCKRNKHRKSIVHCDDCVLGDDKETLEELQKRVTRGDA